MTTSLLHLTNCLFLAGFIVVAFFTRATARRIAGALAGRGAYGVVALGIVALGEEVGWWHMAITWGPYFVTLLWLNAAISCAPAYLVTWRVARRFGWRGLAVVVVLAVLGPVRDYRFMVTYPEWGAYGPGIAPVLAVSANYVMMVVVGYGVMRLVAGPRFRVQGAG